MTATSNEPTSRVLTAPSFEQIDAEFLEIALNTLRQIATTPRNRGARMNANATLKFIETQRDK